MNESKWKKCWLKSKIFIKTKKPRPESLEVSRLKKRVFSLRNYTPLYLYLLFVSSLLIALSTKYKSAAVRMAIRIAPMSIVRRRFLFSIDIWSSLRVFPCQFIYVFYVVHVIFYCSVVVLYITYRLCY